MKIRLKDFLKHFLRKEPIHNFLCFMLFLYIRFVYLTSVKKVIGAQNPKKFIKNGKAVILCTWHSRILLSPLVALEAAKGVNSARFGVLASKHKDGQIASKTMAWLNFKEILGSSINKTKGSTKNNGGISAIRNLVTELKNGRIFCIAPDGPRGPAKKCNSEIINIAKLADVPIIPVSISTSKHKILNTWDKFHIVFPFSQIIIEFGKPIYEDIKKEKDTDKFKKILEKKIDTLIKKNDQKFINLNK